MFPSLTCLPAPPRRQPLQPPVCPALGLVLGAQGREHKSVPSLMGTQRAVALTAALLAAPPSEGDWGGQDRLQGEPLSLGASRLTEPSPGRESTEVQGDISRKSPPPEPVTPPSPGAPRESREPEPGVQGTCSHSRAAKAGSLVLENGPGLGRFPGRSGSPPREKCLPDRRTSLSEGATVWPRMSEDEIPLPAPSPTHILLERRV